MTELLNFPDGTVQHAYLTTDNANDDLEIAVLDGDLVILDTNENPVLRWDASATQWDFVSQDVVGVGSIATEQITTGKIGFGSPVSKTISSGEIAYGDDSFIQVSGEGDSADDLDYITGGSTGDVVIIVPNGANTITVRDAQGGANQLLLDGSTDFSMDDVQNYIALIRRDDIGVGVWIEMWRSSPA